VNDPQMPTEPLSDNWKKYVHHLEKRNREISTLFHRSDNALKGYKKAVIPFQERINNLEIQNQTREKTINKLNKRIERRNESIKKLKEQLAATAASMYAPTPPLHAQMPSMTRQMSDVGLTSSAMSSVSTSTPMLLPEQEQYFKSVQRQYNHMEQQQQQLHDLQHQQQMQQQQSSYVKPKRSKKIRKSRGMKNNNGKIRMDSMQHRAYQSDASVASYTSSHSSNSRAKVDNNATNDSSILGSFTSMAFGYILGAPTPQ